MIVKFVQGDLLEAFERNMFDAIVHGCNCHHTMGAGIAGVIRNRYIHAYNADLKTDFGSWEKLGTYSVCDYYHSGLIINGYTQWEPGKCPPFQLHDNIKTLFKKLNEDYKGATIGIPKIGAGIAGGNWDIISTIIDNVTPDLKIIVYYLE